MAASIIARASANGTLLLCVPHTTTTIWGRSQYTLYRLCGLAAGPGSNPPSIMASPFHYGVPLPSWRPPFIIGFPLHHGVPLSSRGPHFIMGSSFYHGVPPFIIPAPPPPLSSWDPPFNMGSHPLSSRGPSFHDGVPL